MSDKKNLNEKRFWGVLTMMACIFTFIQLGASLGISMASNPYYTSALMAVAGVIGFYLDQFSKDKSRSIKIGVIIGLILMGVFFTQNWF